MTEEGLSFWAELKRRRVYRTAAWYGASVFVVWQVADIVIPAVGLPPWIMKAIVILSAVGFIPALALSWAYDIRSVSAARMRRAVIAVTIPLFAATGFWVTKKAKPATRTLSDISLAVFPFTVHGANLSYLREGLVDLLSRNLTGTSELQPLDPSLMLKVTEGKESDAQTAGSIARQVGAGRFVLGNVTGAGARIRIDATLYAVKDSTIAVTTRMVQGDTTQLFQLVDELTASLLAELNDGAATREAVNTAARTTQSLPALKAYLQGEQAYRQGDHSAAVAAFQDAIALDSTFVLPRYRMAISYNMSRKYWLARNAMLAASSRKQQFSSHDQRVIDAFVALHNGNVTTAEQSLNAIINEFPRDLESRVLLADIIAIYNPWRAASRARAVELLQSVLEADPKFVCIACHLGELAQTTGDYELSEKVFKHLAARRGEDSTRVDALTAIRLALFRGDSAGARSAIPALRALYPDSTAFDMWIMNPAPVAVGLGAFTFADAVLGDARFGRGRPFTRTSLSAELNVARGQWQSARKDLAQILQRPDADNPYTDAYSLLTKMPAEFSPPELAQVREAVERMQPDTSSAPVNEAARAERGERFFALGLASSRLGDAAAVRTYLDSLVTLEQNPLDASSIRNARMILLADRALRENKAADAAAKLESMSMQLRPGQLLSWMQELNYAGQLRVWSYIVLKRNNDALQWLRYNRNAFGSPPAWQHGTFERDMAQVLDQLGQKEEAVRHYAAFINAWQNADAELQPQVVAARRRLKELLPRP